MSKYDSLTDDELIALGESVNESTPKDELIEIATTLVIRLFKKNAMEVSPPD